ncbi:MAG: glycosyltransferase family 39 protein [Lachnospiraceae bacterium]|nr:glycosyltransferase family 39 protein [Lachnospiraceae bacterium]
MSEFMIKNKKRSENLIIACMWIIAALVMVKSIFTDFGYDNAYQIAMSYRYISGDRMFLQMWEPHQMSKFLTDLLVLIFRVFSPDYTGVALFTQVMGTVTSLLIAAGTVKLLSGYIDRLTGNALLIFLAVFKVKQTPFIDYAGQMIYFSILVFCFLLLWEKERLPVYTVLAGACTFLQVLSYPTALVSLIPAIIFLATVKGEKKGLGILAYIGGGGLPALVYAAYFIVNVGFVKLLNIATYIFYSDSHSSTPHFGEYWMGLIWAAVFIIACALVSAVLWFTLGRKRNISFSVLAALCMAVGEPISLFVTRNLEADLRCFVYIVPSILIMFGAPGIEKMTEGERRVWLLGTALSFASFVAALFLSDLGILTILAYLMLGGAVSFIPLKHVIRDYRQFLVLMVCLVLFHRGLVVWGYGNASGRVMLTTEVQNIIRDGPACGIVCDHMNKAKFSVDLEELRRSLSKDDKVLVVGPEIMDPLVFLYTEAEISNFSVIDTPKFNEALEEYYAMNPDKFPTVVLTDCWFSVSNIPEDSYIMSWVESNFEPVEDLSYYRVYRKR